jgi:hypothetical protein
MNEYTPSPSVERGGRGQGWRLQAGWGLIATGAGEAQSPGWLLVQLCLFVLLRKVLFTKFFKIPNCREDEMKAKL